MRLADVDDLPPTLDTAQAAELLGVSRDHLWKLAREGAAPVEPLRLGSALRWPTARLTALLGLQRDEAPATTGAPSDLTAVRSEGGDLGDAA